MNDIIVAMVKRFDIRTDIERDHAVRQTIQEMVLESLSHTDFFEKVSFNGGTALRIFHNLDRFSEDLDFFLKVNADEFDFEYYIRELRNNLSRFGIDFITDVVNKANNNNIKKGMVSTNTKNLVMSFFLDDRFADSICESQLTKIKIEVDIDPAPYSISERTMSTLPFPYSISVADMSTMFSGKIHAILCRGWKNRVKGRDLYDFVFFINNKTSVNYMFLKEKLITSGYDGEKLTFDEVKRMLVKKFNDVDYKSAKDDIINFISTEHVVGLDAWCPEFFVSLCDKLRKV